MFLDEDPTKIDYAAISYLTGECNYGGRVTDDKDRILIMTLLNDFYNDKMVLEPDYKFTNNDIYKYPGEASTHE
jgi:dynein heavy chain, axonemal